MRIRNVLLSVLIGLLLFAALLLALVAWADFTAVSAFSIFFLVALIIFIALGITWFRHHAYILVDEMDTAVIFKKSTNNFAYFIDSKPSKTIATGRPYNLHKTSFLNKRLKDPYHHFINPFKERVEARIPKKPLSVTETTENIRTKKGIPIKISWKINYNIDITLIKNELEPNMSRALPNFHENMMKGNTTQILYHLIEQKSVEELYTAGAIEALEEDLETKIKEKMGKLGFTKIDPRVGPVRVPMDVEKAIEEAHERELKTETAVKSLEQIRNAIRSYNDKDLSRLAELEKLRLLDQHGASMLMSMPGMGYPGDTR